MSDSPPSLCTLLSHALVAFTIEADNLFESRAPHSTTSGGPVRGGGPWLVSMVMWMNCLRHLVDGPRTLGGLFSAAGTGTNVDGMRRWGYIAIDLGGRQKPGRDSPVTLTKRGRLAETVWASVVPEIEGRWATRHARYPELRALLEPLGRSLAELPSSMPILGYGFALRDNVLPRCAPALGAEESLPELIARPLVQIAVSFEEQAPVSLAMYADILAALDSEGVLVRDLPGRTGVSKEAVAMATGYLEKQGLVSLETTPKTVRLTQTGLDAVRACRSALRSTENSFEREFEAGQLQELLESVYENLHKGLVPVPGGWRKSAPAKLPNFPMTLHRGGYPDGA